MPHKDAAGCSKLPQGVRLGAHGNTLALVIRECEVKRVLTTRIIPGLNDVDETEEEEGLLMAAENDGD